MRLRSIILAMAICAAPWVAQAQPIQGVYVGAGAGANIPLATKNTSNAPGFKGMFDLDQKLGYDGRLSLGYALGDGWRFELEGTLGKSSVKGVTGAAYPTSGTGTVRNLGVMANALFDLDIGSPYVFPYLGLGLGYQSTRLNGFVATRSDPSASFTASGEAGGVAGQVIGGFSFPIPNMPGLSVTADYRLMDILGGEKFNGVSSGAPASTTFRNQYVQSVIVGVRYAFNTPPPPGVTAEAPSLPPPPEAQSYQVFFASGDATLDGRADGVLREAARTAAKGQNARIEVSGKSDTPGSVTPALSERREMAVRMALIADGLSQDAISVDTPGETKRFIAIGPGIVQPRRVEIAVR